MTKPVPTLSRTTFITKRAAEYFSEPELRMHLGYPKPLWPLLVVKELADNALDAIENTDGAPEIDITIADDAITVEDNGPGLKESTIAASLDYDVRASDKKWYSGVSRGQLGNALKCVWPVAFVATGEKKGVVEVTACGLHHLVEVGSDPITLEPLINRETSRTVKNGTCITVHWRGVACLPIDDGSEFYQSTVKLALPDMIRDLATVNPHASFVLTVCGKRLTFKASDPGWKKWRTNSPTSAWWYQPEDLRDLIAAYLRHMRDVESHPGENDKPPTATVRDFVEEFEGLKSTVRRKRVLEQAGLARASLADLVKGDDGDMARVGRLLAAMKANSKPVNAQRLGVIGKDHMQRALAAYGADKDFEYARHAKLDGDGMPYVVEIAFGTRLDDGRGRRLICGLNNSVVLKIPSAHLDVELA